ncbi:MAG: hypothetical protein L0Z62_23640 [Gemmataceae bacterium]|nr:hypothetical protein [Gemmataceae bacterium]
MTASLRAYLVGVVLVVFGLLAARITAQPTYKLVVGTHLRPLATIKLNGTTVSRSGVKDDPGFRLQYRFARDGKEIATLDARANATTDVPRKEAGTYTAVLEMFYPTYKPGKQQRGQFRPISNVLTYRVEATKPGEPGQVVLIEPALLVRCGKGEGKQDGRVEKGYGYQLLQGMSFDGWPDSAACKHCWQDPKLLRFELTLPEGTGGTLRLYCVDGDGKKRKQTVSVQGKARGTVEAFEGIGTILEIILPAAEVPSGRVEVTVQPLPPGTTAVVSGIEFVPSAKK